MTSLRTEGAVVGFLKVFRDETARRQIEEKLWDSLTLLDSVVNGTNEVMYLKNAELRYELVNSAAALQFAKPRSELIGLDDFELYPREVALRLRKNDTKTIDSGALQLVEEEIEVRGLRRIILAQLNPWRDHEGKIIGVVGVHTDITALRQAERDVRGRREYERLYNEAPVAYHEIDRTGTITRVNQAECTLLGRSESELIGKPVWSFLVPEQRAASAEAIERKLRDEADPAPCQRIFVRKNGAPVAVWVHDSKILDENGGAIGLRSILVAAA